MYNVILQIRYLDYRELARIHPQYLTFHLVYDGYEHSAISLIRTSLSIMMDRILMRCSPREIPSKDIS